MESSAEDNLFRQLSVSHVRHVCREVLICTGFICRPTITEQRVQGFRIQKTPSAKPLLGGLHRTLPKSSTFGPRSDRIQPCGKNLNPLIDLNGAILGSTAGTPRQIAPAKQHRVIPWMYYKNWIQSSRWSPVHSSFAKWNMKPSWSKEMTLLFCQQRV